MFRAAQLGALIAVALLVAVPQGQTADVVIEAIEKLTDLVVRKDNAAVDKQARKIAEESDLELLMGLMGPRGNGGLGVGPKAGTIQPDNIEEKLTELTTKRVLTEAEYKAQAVAIRRMGLHLAALAAVTQHLDPGPKAKAAQWKNFSEEMQKRALELAEATTPAQIKAAAGKLNNACTQCHKVYD